MPPEEQEKIFDLIYSTRKGGTGLGLAIVERIAQTHGGRITVKSTPRNRHLGRRGLIDLRRLLWYCPHFLLVVQRR
jgi:signal transduction histidine kinase